MDPDREVGGIGRHIASSRPKLRSRVTSKNCGRNTERRVTGLIDRQKLGFSLEEKVGMIWMLVQTCHLDHRSHP